MKGEGRRRQLSVVGLAAAMGAFLVAIIVFTASGSGSGGPTDDAIGDGELRVMTTTNFITDTVAEVGGERVTVEPLMGPGVDPHLYRASAGDVAKLADADVVFYGGLHLEGKMEEVLEEVTERKPAVAVTSRIDHDELIPSAPGSTGEFDPHVWFDVGLWSQAVATVRDALIEADPEGSHVYEENASRYLERLARLDREVRDGIASIPERRRVLITSHDAFRYLGRAYDLEVTGIQGISTQSEATTADIERIAELIAERGIKAVFVESSVPPQTIDAVVAAARERGADVAVGGELFSDAAGEPGTREGTYVGMVEHNLEQLVEGLR
jgi:manganese/zinc/iron transport system substrate-binding protein